MSKDEWRTFIGAATRTGKVAVTRKDGQALVTPVWFLLDTVVGDDGVEVDELVFTTHSSGAKARILRREPRVSMLVDDQVPPYSYVQLQGVARLLTDHDTMLLWATRLGARYMGEERAESYGRRNSGEGEYLVRVRITKIIARAGIAD